MARLAAPPLLRRRFFFSTAGRALLKCGMQMAARIAFFALTKRPPWTIFTLTDKSIKA
jgi:hypothetical protein